MTPYSIWSGNTQFLVSYSSSSGVSLGFSVGKWWFSVKVVNRLSSSAPSLVYDRGDCAAVSKAGVAVKSSAYKHLSESRESICKSISRVYFGASDLYDRGYSQYLVVVQASRQSNAPRNRYSAHQTYKLMHTHQTYKLMHWVLLLSLFPTHRREQEYLLLRR